MNSILPRKFYARSAALVALDLLGKMLWHRTPEGMAGGRIVEVEAYPGEIDPASHAFRGPTPRTRIVWSKPGVAYVYLNYGMHCCLNIVAGEIGVPDCVLIRALEPTAGLPLMGKRRKTEAAANLTSGPGKLTQALKINRSHNGLDVTRGDLVIRESEAQGRDIVVTGRIGISREEAAPLRFFLKDHPLVSCKNKAEVCFCGRKAAVIEFLRKNGFIYQR
jgi:DNA-3-methyladenine glycosylase